MTTQKLRKEAIILKLQEWKQVKNIADEIQDFDIAITALMFDKYNFIDRNIFYTHKNNKDFFIFCVDKFEENSKSPIFSQEAEVTELMLVCQLMDDSLKADKDFALEMFNISQKSIHYFSDSVKYSPEIISTLKKHNYIEDEFINYFYKNDKDFLVNKVRHDYKFALKVKREFSFDKEIVLAIVEHNNMHAVDYISLPDVIKNDFDFLKKYIAISHRGSVVYKDLLKKLAPHLKDPQKHWDFTSTYKEDFNIDLVKVLIKNKDFASVIKPVMDENPKETSFDLYIREYILGKRFAEQKSNEIKPKLSRNKL